MDNNNKGVIYNISTVVPMLMDLLFNYRILPSEPQAMANKVYEPFGLDVKHVIQRKKA